MGLDMTILFAASEETADKMHAILEDRVPGLIQKVLRYNHEPHEDAYNDDLAHIPLGLTWWDAYTLSRWYGVGYERGDWPDLFACMAVLLDYADHVVVGADYDAFYDARKWIADTMPHFISEGYPYRRMSKARSEAWVNAWAGK